MFTLIQVLHHQVRGGEVKAFDDLDVTGVGCPKFGET